VKTGEKRGGKISKLGGKGDSRRGEGIKAQSGKKYWGRLILTGGKCSGRRFGKQPSSRRLPLGKKEGEQVNSEAADQGETTEQRGGECLPRSTAELRAAPKGKKRDPRNGKDAGADKQSVAVSPH